MASPFDRTLRALAADSSRPSWWAWGAALLLGSVWLGWFQAYILNRFSLLCDERKDHYRANDYRTKAEFFIRGITGGFIEAAEVIAWSDEIIVSAPKTEDWMVEISSCSPDERLKVLGFLNTVKGTVDEAALAAMLKARQ